MSDSERIYLPGWVKPSVALALALLGAGATAGWVGANYARNTDSQMQEIRVAIRDTQREVCAIRSALNVTAYTTICEERHQLSSALKAEVLPVAWTDYLPQSPDQELPATAIVAILAGLSMGLFILGSAGFLICWAEILRMRKRVHQHDTDLSTVNLELGIKKLGQPR